VHFHLLWMLSTLSSVIVFFVVVNHDRIRKMFGIFNGYNIPPLFSVSLIRVETRDTLDIRPGKFNTISVAVKVRHLVL